MYSRQFCQMEVPPSQWRVYRISPFTEESNGRSALTRAGISYIKQHQRRRQLFRPHKGGYIVSLSIFFSLIWVPPSQGRVYRFCIDNMDDLVSSALTRAGISPCNILSRIAGEFRPHKGGYIVRERYCKPAFVVPPSQGWVYRFSIFRGF